MNEKYYGVDEEYGMEGDGNDLPKSSRVASHSNHDSKQVHIGMILKRIIHEQYYLYYISTDLRVGLIRT